jgi:hypothetical protein
MALIALGKSVHNRVQMLFIDEIVLRNDTYRVIGYVA